MFKLTGTNVSITHGDSAYIEISITQEDGAPYILNEGDEIKLQVRHEANGGELLFDGLIEEIRPNQFVWHIRPEDTANAEVKDYFWDAQLKTANGDIFTFITKSKFRITDEVTE